MPNQSNRFFVPFVGEKYKKGINGKKVLVVGASFYCDKHDCPYFSDCTSPEKKDSSYYNTICPEYVKHGAELKFEPRYAIEENYHAYQRFEKLMREVVGSDLENIWEHIAFNNYVQFFIPTKNTYKNYLSDRDFEAFIETLVELQPDLVISWGMVTIDDVRTNNIYVIDKEKLPNSEWYICRLKVPDINHYITLFCCFHPSSKSWDEDFGKCAKYLRLVIDPENMKTSDF